MYSFLKCYCSIVKKILFLLAFLLINIVVFSQSKEQTKEWILSKLNKYGRMDKLYSVGETDYYYGPNTFYFNGDELIFKSKIVYYEAKDRVLGKKISESTGQSVCQAKNFSDIRITDNPSADSYPVVEIKSTDQVFDCCLDLNGEEDLLVRLKKAFLHLKELIRAEEPF